MLRFICAIAISLLALWGCSDSETSSSSSGSGSGSASGALANYNIDALCKKAGQLEQMEEEAETFEGCMESGEETEASCKKAAELEGARDGHRTERRCLRRAPEEKKNDPEGFAILADCIMTSNTPKSLDTCMTEARQKIAKMNLDKAMKAKRKWLVDWQTNTRVSVPESA